jgi:hypothetical protein
LKQEPLFISFLNSRINVVEVINTVLGNSKDEKTIEIARNQKDKKYEISIFRKDFKSAVEDLIENGVNQKFINYVNSYMKPSLEEFSDQNTGSRSNENRYIVIKAEDTPWIEAIICYNMCIFIRAYGISSIKKCSVCGTFFSHKGKYAKYCSDSCKASRVS